MLTAAWRECGRRTNTAWLQSPFQPIASLSPAGSKGTVPTQCPCSVVMALDRGNGRAWLMLLLMAMICMERMRMVLVMVLRLGFCGHWAQVGTVGDGGGIVTDHAGGWLPLFR